MSNISSSLLVFVITATLGYSSPGFAVSTDVEAAAALLQQMHADQCHKHKLQGQLLAAHQSHDQEKLKNLWPQLEAINKRLKPSEDQLSKLKVGIRKNVEDNSAFEAAQLRVGDCD